MRLLSTLWMLALPFVLSACGMGASVSADHACQDYATARCNERAMCSATSARVTRDYGSFDTCVSREKIACLDSVGAPGTGASAEGFETCAKAVPSETCADFFLGNVASACVFHGVFGTGMGCTFAGQCTTSFCGIPKGSACGTCAATPAVGDSCASIGCGRGLTCSKALVCVLEGGLGAACDANNPCGLGLGCVGESATAMGTFQTSGTTLGQACVRQPTGSGCDARLGLYCNAMTMLCTAIDYANDGAPCGVVDRASVGCAGGGLCVIPDGMTAGTCKAPAVDGGACDTSTGPPCLSPARCIATAGATSGTCMLADPSGCG